MEEGSEEDTTELHLEYPRYQFRLLMEEMRE